MSRDGHVDLVDPAHEHALGTLSLKAWAKLNRKLQKARWYADYDGSGKLPGNPDEEIAMSISSALGHAALRTSGSIGGQHRRDVRDAIIGAPQVGSVGLGLPPSLGAGSDSDAQREASQKARNERPFRGGGM